MFGRITPMVKNLLIINAAVYFLAEYILPGVTNYGALRYINSTYFLPFQIVTYMFLHGGFWHLFSNMFGLFIFGPLLEQVWGSKRFLVYYMACGIGAGVLYAGSGGLETLYVKNSLQHYQKIEHPTTADFTDVINVLERHADQYLRIGALRDFKYEYAEQGGGSQFEAQSKQLVYQISEAYSNARDQFLLVGASGAIFGIILAFGLLFPDMQLMLLFPPIPIKAKYLVMFYGAYEFLSGVSQRPGDNVAHFAHIAGMLVGYLILRQWKKQHGNFY
ncbi:MULTISPECIES: rhomboid family intramembrane serine protease [Persicobacter]|uniref:Rhomboid family intramembrane serine protease n=1 Tax=Persicobacter diffluens TaxID=981 RepID=A0AAN4VXQ9_9BACT|nr:rhomboid family intramembrane serine protease [Persicobacter sp. CCB-QB2]GJM61979.1 rhomboid family intramembrane serine protease [Persicobacter diffluens]